MRLMYCTKVLSCNAFFGKFLVRVEKYSRMKYNKKIQERYDYVE